MCMRLRASLFLQAKSSMACVNPGVFE